MNEAEAIKRLRGIFDHVYVLNNVFVFGWESDYFGVTKASGYIYEIEVKLTIADLKADFRNKHLKHRCLNNANLNMISIPQKPHKEYEKTGNKIERRGQLIEEYDYVEKNYCPLHYKMVNNIPNRFFYAIPEELYVKASKEIPNYAGIITLGESNGYKIKKNAPLIHKNKILKDIKPILLEKFYWKYQDVSFQLNEAKREIEQMKNFFLPDFNNKILNYLPKQ